MVDALRAQGWLVAVATNKPLVPTRIILEHTGLMPRLSGVRGGDGPKKPDPTQLRELFAENGSVPADGWMVGDHFTGPPAAAPSSAAGASAKRVVCTPMASPTMRRTWYASSPRRPAPMRIRDADGYPVTPELVLAAYRQGCFPMAEDRDSRFRWYRPVRRAIITWDRWKVPRSLAKTARRVPFTLTIDRACPRVIAACARRDETWICHDIEALYTELHRQGHVHSVEAWAGDTLVGGLYGVAIGGCFCGESMFHDADDAAKLCVVHLAEHLRTRGFTLLDCQQQTPHMQRFGAYEVDADAYAGLLAAALTVDAAF